VGTQAAVSIAGHSIQSNTCLGDLVTSIQQLLWHNNSVQLQWNLQITFSAVDINGILYLIYSI